MPVNEIVTGQRYRWKLLEKLGEGDAGEVYLVESLLEKKAAILKRPRLAPLSSDEQRQASQIEMEGKILRALPAVLSNAPRAVTSLPGSSSSPAAVPALLDQSPDGAAIGERLFIILEKAPGFDLNTLARLARFGQVDPASGAAETSLAEQVFLQRVAQKGEVPRLILLRTLAAVIELFEQIHFAEAYRDGDKQSGVIWNDIKPEHLFWDPARACLTLIDWGNGQFLEPDGTTQDRRWSRLDDYYQFMQEMGAYLANTSPQLSAALAWPDDLLPGNAYTEGVKPLKERVFALLQEELAALREARRRENDLIQVEQPDGKRLQKLEAAQELILDFGEIPDYRGALKFYTNLAAILAASGDLAAFKELTERIAALPAARPEKWRLLAQIAQVALQEGSCPGSENGCEALRRAIRCGVQDDWPDALWELLSSVQSGPEPPWWDAIYSGIREQQLETSPQTLTPFIAFNRLFHTLQAASQKLSDSAALNSSLLGESMPDAPPSGLLQASQALLKALKEDVLQKWKEIEPDPPDSRIEYQAIDRLMGDIEHLAPDALPGLVNSLDQPKAQVKIVMDAWNGQDFETARRGLRRLLLWDPDRRRVLQADRAILAAPKWQERIRQGARKGETPQDFLTHAELAGRELRNQVGPARWLDLILETFMQLRKGARPADLLLNHPELLIDIPWLDQYSSRETIHLPRSKTLTLEREQAASLTGPVLRGTREGKLGQERDLSLGRPLDTWAPEARGSSARVFAGLLRYPAGPERQAAVKIMRAGQAAYALPLFREEAQVLSLLRDVPGVTHLVECGFIRLDEGLELPPDDRHLDGGGLAGVVLRYGVEEVQNFLISLDPKVDQGWLPYLALEQKSQESNLMLYCDASHTRGRYLPLRESLVLAIQICDILQVAQDRNIVYRDHKILHYYWDEAAHGVSIIDWNIAKRYPQGLSAAEKQFDLVQFGARGLHHILTGRAAAGALPLGPNRPEEIEEASHHYQVQWTYDDERLPNQVKEILAQALAEGYSEARTLRQDLYQAFLQIPEQTPD